MYLHDKDYAEMRLSYIFIFLGCWITTLAQSTLTKQDQLDAITTFRTLLSIPNDANYPDDIMMNVVWCEEVFDALGFETTRLETETLPLLLAEYDSNSAGKETVLVYLQVDGQPVDSNFWYQENPYIAVLKAESKDGGWKQIPWDTLESNYDPDWRIFARSASDAKGPVAMFLKAMELIKEDEETIPFNLKVILDFEEELGSPRLAGAVDAHKNILSADHMVIFDGPMHPSNQPTLSFGARGIVTVTLKVYGPDFPQHSGHYGNYVPNPALKLAQLLASMKDTQGRVSIPGWYDGIQLDEETKKILAAVPDDEQALQFKMSIAQPDNIGTNYQESIQYPSLNIRGMLAGWVGNEVRTIIPSVATAEIDIRTVKESDPENLIRLLQNHIRSQGYHLVTDKPTKKEKMSHPLLVHFDYEINYQAFRTELNSTTGQWLRSAMKKKNGSEPIMKRTSGGSIPISPFVITLGVPAVTVPTVNSDNNQHSPNENLRLGNFVDGIQTIRTILTHPIR
ncbi:M20/M25/M40 family metallo-hydrolase [Portibacter marinus]|uniref:M20/M25/M40 family metallo-hydrolase n=1 Tax=Portibacter marinus TaxID=2898660 RepID=UPI001F3B72D6|nr:M20/M25/M40 family metallo-hydrolase [Portibacter marinus]